MGNKGRTSHAMVFSVHLSQLLVWLARFGGFVAMLCRSILVLYALFGRRSARGSYA